MREFDVLNICMPLTTAEARSISVAEYDRAPGDEPDEVKAVRATLKAHGERRLFAYSGMDPDWGCTSADEETTVEMFVKGDDQREYDTLMGIVAANRASCGLPVEYLSPSECAMTCDFKHLLC